MAGLVPLLGRFLGVEARPVNFQGDVKNWPVSAPGVLEEAGVSAYGLGGSGERFTWKILRFVANPGLTQPINRDFSQAAPPNKL